MSLFSFIKSKLSISDVIAEYVQLKHAGNYWKGPCPFHAEKDASFTVTPGREIFYCFGCHAGGDVIAFIAKAENIGQIEAAKHLIDRYGLEVPESARGEIEQLSASFSEKEHHFMVCKAASEWFAHALEQNQQALDYLEKRKISALSQNAFQIGYLPGGMRTINSFIADMAKKNILLKDLIDTGILSQGKAAYYSPFEERIIFPISDQLGRICGFGGRIFKHNDERAKYYNSKDAPAFQKGSLFFGLSLAKVTMKEKGSAFLVEGYTDCVAMWQHGYQNTVATLGTACTQEHLKIIARYVHTLYVLYDGDSAGQKAILRLVELCWEVDLELRVIKLPQKDDPASYLSLGGNLEGKIGESLDIFSFCIQETGENLAGKSLQEKLDLGTRIINLLSNIPDPLKRDLLAQQAAATLKIPFESLRKQIMRSRKTPHPYKDPEQENRPKNEENLLNSMSQLERSILFAIINSIDKKEAHTIDQEMISYFSSPFQTILGHLKTAKQTHQPHETFAAFYDALGEYEKQWVSSCIVQCGGEIAPAVFNQLLTQFYKEKWKETVQTMKESMVRSEHHSRQDDLKELSEKFLKLKEEVRRRGLI